MAEELTLDDIAESIGPREDPVIEDCLTTIALSTAFDGCLVNDIKVHSSEVMILKPEQIHMPIALPALPPAFDRASHHYQISPLGSEPTVRTAPHIASDQGGGFSASPR
ncbi:hypothetical protein [Sphingobium boeckii]|uniref:Uncharacterized protein n=1 Tax=Sphingobium boeckii TaxID=1082345 RepID=A0A7W9EF23_9SPHN|nr:hypothetical protein [Sphingobium boeckii]MBB5685266.1 hypothetical protein [Sphingobium boeckii]